MNYLNFLILYCVINSNQFINLIFIIILIVFILIAVSFLTLLEQKGLSYIQLRKGPNKVRIVGLLQPFCDAIKLFSKEYINPKLSNYGIYLVSPVLALLVSLIIWLRFPFIFKLISFNLRFIFLLCCLSMGVYSVILAGWSSNSNYALLGSLRSIAQTISYEVCLILILLSYFIFIFNLNLFYFNLFQTNNYFLLLNFPITVVMLIVFLAETNRSPFDFSEGESELVSGFNVEYRRGGFALIFLAEYSSILFISVLFNVILLGSNLFNLFFFIKIMFISFIYIWIRARFPRYQYDLLMYLSWKKYLPISLNFLLFFSCLIYFIN
jgi:NADH-ubiquinone oxidoreductase chain 1